MVKNMDAVSLNDKRRPTCTVFTTYNTVCPARHAANDMLQQLERTGSLERGTSVYGCPRIKCFVRSRV
jgi:hypothetical protein